MILLHDPLDIFDKKYILFQLEVSFWIACYFGKIIHYKNSENFAETVLKVKSIFGIRETPSWPGIVKLVQKFELLVGKVSDVKNRTSDGTSMLRWLERLVSYEVRGTVGTRVTWMLIATYFFNNHMYYSYIWVEG